MQEKRTTLSSFFHPMSVKQNLLAKSVHEDDVNDQRKTSYTAFGNAQAQSIAKNAGNQKITVLVTQGN